MKNTLVILLIISGCSFTPVRYSHIQNGEKVYVTTCNGNYSNIANCHQNASLVCQGKYKAKAQESFQTVDHTTTEYDEIEKSSTSTTSQSVGRTLLFNCVGVEANLEVFNQ